MNPSLLVADTPTLAAFVVVMHFSMTGVKSSHSVLLDSARPYVVCVISFQCELHINICCRHFILLSITLSGLALLGIDGSCVTDVRHFSL